MRNDESVSRTAVAEIRDLRPPSVRFQDAAILEYAARNRLVRGGAPEDPRGNGRAADAPCPGRMRKPRRKGSGWTAARAEGIYRVIAPPGQEYPLQAVALVRRLLAKGAPDEFVQGKYQAHVRDCSDIGVVPMRLIPYLTDLLEIHRLDTKAARRNGTPREYSIP